MKSLSCLGLKFCLLGTLFLFLIVRPPPISYSHNKYLFLMVLSKRIDLAVLQPLRQHIQHVDT